MSSTAKAVRPHSACWNHTTAGIARQNCDLSGVGPGAECTSSTKYVIVGVWVRVLYKVQATYDQRGKAQSLSQYRSSHAPRLEGIEAMTGNKLHH